MDPITELATLLKERDNKNYLGPKAGTVINPLPDIRVSLGDEIILDSRHLIIAKHIYIHYEKSIVEPPYVQYLETGDDVILIPSTDNQLFFLIDKAVRP